MNCIVCHKEVQKERLEFLLETKRQVTCLDCVSESRKTGFMDFNHKTAPQLVILPEDQEIKRIARRAFCRAR